MSEIVRWAGSFVLAVAGHAAAAVMVVEWAVPAPVPQSMPPAVVLLDLDPLPAVPEAPSTEAPPGPELSEAIPEPEPPPPVEMPPPVMAEVTLPEPEPMPPLDLKPPPVPTPIEKKVERKPAPPMAPPQAPAPRQAAAAPIAGNSVEPPSPALPTWKGVLLRHLERHKRYPPEAQRARHEGVTYVRFIMSRDGRVLAARTERPAGFASLDEEGLELLRRAQPLPPLPMDQPGESLEIVVPVQFFVRR